MAIKLNYNKETVIRIRDFLLKQGMTLEGAYGMLANLYVESGFRSNNAQNSCVKKLGWTDEEYTAKVDNGEYQNFATDRIGYGLWQSTSSGRKQGLLNYAKSLNKSIGDESMQLNYLMVELSTAYKAVLNVLKTSHDISECAKYVMLKFERPANQTEENQNKRASYGLQLFEEIEGVKNTMTYTNSPLVTYTKLSPNKTSPRKYTIDTIIIHCYVGQVTAERGCNGNRFVNYSATSGASCNYVVGYDGSIGLCVEEKDRAWCSGGKDKNGKIIRVNGISGADNDHRAITIEVASDTTPPYAVTDKALEALIDLCADICKRNNIKGLRWQGDKNLVGQVDKQNMTVHRWFSTKSCPGDYLYDKHPYIADEVNKKLGIKITTSVTNTSNHSYLMKGDKGEDIKVLQENLNYLGYSCGTVDGNFGAKTDTALRNFQKDYKLFVDGKYGANSKKALENAVVTKKEITTNSSTTSSASTSSTKYICNGLDYSLVFDPVYYSNTYSDLKKAFGNNTNALFNHFKTYGVREGRIGKPNFNVNVYKNRYADLQKAFGNDLPSYYKHYLQFGFKEGRNAV